MSEIPYRAGEIARAVFLVLARRKLIGSQELAYLQSVKSATDMGTHGFPVLREFSVGEAEQGLDRNGVRRYYSGYSLRIGRKDYLLCSQFKPSKKDSLMSFVESLGIKRSEILSICDSANS